jgi:transposase
VDESGIDTRLIRTHARAPRGQRVLGSVPGHRERVTLIGALGLGGMVALMTIAAATTAAICVAFIEQVLAPALKERPDAVVLPDNLAAHKTPAVRAAFESAGITYRYLPSDSPDFSPIEPCWGKIKVHLRACARCTREALEAQVPSALRTITVQNIRGWFRHCKYLPG